MASKKITSGYAEEAGYDLTSDVEKSGKKMTGKEELECFVHEGGKGGEATKKSCDEKGCCCGGWRNAGEKKAEEADEEGTKRIDGPRAIRESGTYPFGE